MTDKVRYTREVVDMAGAAITSLMVEHWTEQSGFSRDYISNNLVLNDPANMNKLVDGLTFFGGNLVELVVEATGRDPNEIVQSVVERYRNLEAERES